MTHPKYLSLFISFALIVSACGGGSEEPAPSAQKIDVTSVTLSHTSLQMNPGTSQQLTATVTPSNATNKTISWESSSTSVATVSSTGLVNAVADGTATITATADGKSATCEVTVVSSVIYEGEDATIDLSTVTSVTQLQNEIKKADEQGVTNYKIVGECKDLGITSAKNARNVFANTNASTIDMSQVTGWPIITKDALYYSQDGKNDATHMAEELPGVPAGFFYQSNSSVKELILPAEVQAIGEKAFCELSTLETLTAPGIKVIGEQAMQATAIKEINFPNAASLGRAWSCHNHSLTTVYLPSATYMGANGLSDCNRLSSMSMPKLETVSNFAFTENPALTNVNLPAARNISDGAFCKCTALMSVELPAAETIGNTEGHLVGPFYGCSSLSSISIPNAKTIGIMSFEGCSTLKEISLPLVTVLCKNAFYECSSLSSINLPLVTSIKEGALAKCRTLKNISLPNATEIGENAISNNPRLQTLSLTASGNISFGKQNSTFESSVIDLILNQNKRTEVEHDYIWQGMTWLSISFK